jgi:hypothetical protein
VRSTRSRPDFNKHPDFVFGWPIASIASIEVVGDIMPTRASILLLLGVAAASAAAAAPAPPSAFVVATLPNAHRHTRLAAAELRRYIGLVEGGGARPALAEVDSAAALDALPARRAVLVATAAEAALLGVGVAPAPAREGGAYTISSPRSGLSVVVGSDALHSLYGAYTLLETVGCTFSTAGATHPTAGAARWHAFEQGFRQDDAPFFSTRGLQPFHDFMEGPDFWGEDETKRVIESILTMKGNLIGFHTYPLVEPAVWVGLNTSVLPGGNVSADAAYTTTWRNTLNGGWGYNPLPTEQLGFGAGQIFEHSCFGHETVSGNARLCPSPVDANASAELFNLVGAYWQKTFKHAAALGIQTILGTEMPLSMPAPPAPAPPAPGALVAMQLWYSQGRDDHFVSASACPECDGAYNFVGTMGWAYSSQMPGAVPLITCAGALPNGQIDNALVTGACPPGHGQIRIEAYALAAAGTPGTEPLTQWVNNATGHHWAATAAYAANATAAGFTAAGVIAYVFSAGPPVPPQPDAFDFYVGIFTRLTALLGDTLTYYWSWTPEGWEWDNVDINNPLIQDAVHDTQKMQAAHDFLQPSFKLATCGWVVGPKGARWYYDTVTLPSLTISSIDMDVGNTPVDPAYANITHRPAANKWASIIIETLDRTTINTP